MNFSSREGGGGGNDDVIIMFCVHILPPAGRTGVLYCMIYCVYSGS